MADALLPPNSELVARAWLALVPGITPTMVGTTLPRISDSLPEWAQPGAPGFVTVAVVGGSPSIDTALAEPVVGVRCWAVNARQDQTTGAVTVSNKPPWGRANALAESIRQASYTLNRDGRSQRQLVLPAPDYAPAAVLSAYLLTEPRRMPGDAASYACYQFDLQLSWISLAPAGVD